MKVTSSTESLQPLSETKDAVIAALRRLKRSASKLGSLKGVPKNFASGIDAEVTNLAEYWQSLEEQSSRPMVTMVGMVNAGKSALGNILLQVGESGVFREGVMRETSEPKSADEGVMQLIDLPGLGSAVAEKDDPVVRRYIRRASVVLIIIGVDAPIPQHLYKFLEEEIEPTQRVVIIMNKVDIFDGYPDSHRDNALDEYKDFLINGNPRLGFPGVRHFFSYEVPIVTFSVHHARSQNNPSYVEPLLTAISSSIDLASRTTIARARAELIRVCQRFEPLNDALSCLYTALCTARSQLDFLDCRFTELFEAEAITFIRGIREIDDACWKTMNRQTDPSWFEKTFETSGLSDKKTALREIRDSSGKQMHHAAATYFSQLRKSMTDMATTIMPEFTLSPVPTKDIYAVLDQIAYANWDVWDDYYFRDKPSSLQTINERTKARFADLINGLESHYQAITAIHNSETHHHTYHEADLQKYEVLSDFCETLSRCYTQLKEV